jgi:hypothetical protein
MKKLNLYKSVLATALVSGIAIAEPEVTGKLTYEGAQYTKTGKTVGSATTEYGSGGSAATSVTNHDKDSFKGEASARIYIDGVFENEDSYHVELQAYNNDEAVDGLKGGKSYTQRDPLREAYVDTMIDDWSLRVGKQQVVWGTADGAKLLDIINPTDYTEMAQNQMEDSRITTFMINAEKIQDDGSSVQIVASQPRENIFAGFNRDTATGLRANGDYAANGTGGADQTSGSNNFGSPFTLKGVDTITGKYNGFLNITPDLGAIAGKFAWGFGKESAMADGRMAGFTVDAFESMKMGGTVAADYSDAGSYMPAAMNLVATAQGGSMLCGFDGTTYTASGGTTYNASTVSNSTCVSGVTNANFDYTDLPDNFESAIIGVAAALNGWSWTPSTQVLKDPDGTTRNPATYAPFIALANEVTGAQMLALGFQGNYNSSLADLDSETDTAFDHMGSANFNTFDTYVGANSEYVYDMPSDADLNLAARYRNTTESGINYSLVGSYNYDPNPVIKLSWHGESGQSLTQSLQAGTNKIVLKDGTTAYGGATGLRPTLRFTQTLERAMNLGGSFDMSIENEELGPIVIRGEALYQKDVYSPIVDKAKLGTGDLVGALKMEKGDKFKYVIGADITVLTNMMISAQIIQERNLDFVDGAESSGRYTADFAAMHLTNGLKKAEKNKEFYSLFLTKPFGESDQHRWNNITMFEENGGRWNRLDVEYTIDDNTIATLEYNKYWGDKNTQFGQLENASNIQAGLKYTF